MSGLWSIGVMHRPIHTLLDTPPDLIRPLEHANGWNLADPFGIVREGRLTVLAEQMIPGNRNGSLVTFEPSADNNLVSPRRIDLVDCHVSYPYVFHWRGRIWMVPETYQANQVRLYVADQFPMRWTLFSVLLDDLPGIDMTLFSHGGRWWMLGTDRRSMYGSVSKLYAWHARSPAGPWLPHAMQPIKEEERLVRPAGTPFTYGTELYRPTQDCREFYGHQVRIHRIIRLTPHEFEEREVCTLHPIPNSPFDRGVHHISAVNGLTLIGGSAIPQSA